MYRIRLFSFSFFTFPLLTLLAVRSGGKIIPLGSGQNRPEKPMVP